MKRARLAVQAVAGLTLGVWLCVYLARETQLTAADRAWLFDNIDIPALVGVFALTFLVLWAGARKWAFLDRVLDHHAPRPVGYYLGHYTWQIWLAQLLPSTVAMIAGRALVTHGGGERNWKRGFKNAMVDQLGELFIIIAFIPASLWQIYSGMSFWMWLLAGTSFTVVGAWIGRRFAPRYFMPQALFWSFLRLAFVDVRLALGAVAFHLPLGNDHIVYAMPIATLTVLIPITPGNLGLAEWGWTYALMLWGEGKSASALYALSLRVLVLVMQTLALPLTFISSRRKEGKTEMDRVS